MKKFLAILLAMMLVLVSVSAALAEGEENTPQYTASTAFTINTGFLNVDASTKGDKTYTVTNPNTAATAVQFPSETVTFTSTAATNNPDGGTANLSIANLTVSAQTSNLSITFPAFTMPGLYHFTVTENDAGTQGVTYNTETIKISALVTFDSTNPSLLVCNTTQVGITKEDENGTKNDDTLENQFDLAKLDITKTVAGNMGDKNQLFDITLKLKAEDEKTVRNAITISGSSDTASNQTVAGGWTGEKTINMKIKHGDTISIVDIPAGVTYTVTEAAAHAVADPTGADGSKGYTVEITGDTAKLAKNDSKTAAITNTKDITLDTGITLETLPYVLILAVAMIGAGMMVIRRRREEY